MDGDESPTNWERRTHEMRSTVYVDYVHGSEDVRIRITPPENTADGGHALDVTLFPYTESSESYDVRAVASRDCAERIAREFIDLFDGAYDGPGGDGGGGTTLEGAATYALQRTRPTEAVGTDVPSRDS
ncbi:hypothetical protein [Halostella pelagica]|uniref:hypothetical protein n=1 Tax=Halostella pelagica TaxID=2583824 RepID=UPI0010801FA2|nr:hypothetical protein [Halostella pelagica]